MASLTPPKKVVMKEPSDFDLFLIGKTGNGKSATGNSILRRKVFESKPSTSSVTTEIDYAVSEFNGKVIKVVDCPGVGDTRINNEEAVNLYLSATEKAIEANPCGFHALLIVVRFGGRFTEEDKNTIAFLKNMFGHDFVKNYSILVMTHGDNFEKAREETGQSFEAWCSEQDGVFKHLLRECDNRIILFDNATKDENIKIHQVATLLTIVDSIRFRCRRYTVEHFSRTSKTRERLTVETKKPIIHEVTMVEMSLIMQKIQELQVQQDLQEKVRALKKLNSRAENLCDNIKLQDCGTGALNDVYETVKSLYVSINEEIKCCNRMIKERENIRQKEKKTRRMLEKQFHEQLEQERRLQEAKLQQQYWNLEKYSRQL